MESYDYIVVGAGAAGSVIAARLAENKNITVLVLESGHDNSYSSNIISNYAKKLIQIPGLNSVAMKRYHNNIDTQHMEASPTMLDYVTTPQYKNIRSYAYPRGVGAGGSTNHHTMIDGRGDPSIYDNIAKEVDDMVWSYKNILPYYKKMESYNVPNANPKIHGSDGWLQVRKSGTLNQDLRIDIVKALKDVYDIPYRTDPGNPSEVAGVYISEEHVNKEGNRSNAYIDLLEPMLKKQNNITIRFNCMVGEVIINNKVAQGVVVYEKPYLNEVDITGNKIDANGNANIPNKSLPKPTKIYARKEVILCGGAIGTPQILMLSGIGPQKHLTDLGIDVKVNLPGVGENLMDHIECNVIFELDPTKFMWEWQATNFLENTDYKKLMSPQIQQVVEKYAKHNSMNDNCISLIWDWYSGKIDSKLAQHIGNMNMVLNKPILLNNPDIHTHVIKGFNFDWNNEVNKLPSGDNLHVKEHSYDNYLPNNSLKSTYLNSQIDPTNPRVFITFLAECLKIKATGNIKLKNNIPGSEPYINIGLWSDDDSVERIALMIIKLRKLIKESHLNELTINPDDNEVLPGSNYDTINKLKEYIKSWQSYGHHIAGTAKMGSNNDIMAVVDSRLRVKGIKGLRIIDASVYPTPYLHAYNPTRGIYMMAEVAADFIKLYQ